jgi:5-methylcytosine-specific restriction endonuclease McrA
MSVKLKWSLMSSNRRRNRSGQILCDLCGTAPATERHHIVPRYAVMGIGEAWKYADSIYLTTLLCRECHDTADLPTNRDRILRAIYKINGRGKPERGYEMTREIFDKLEEYVRLTWGIPSWQE